MSKEEAVTKLKELGYEAVLEKGVVLFLYKTPEEYENLDRTARKILDEIGYAASWGIKYHEKNPLIDIAI